MIKASNSFEASRTEISQLIYDIRTLLQAQPGWQITFDYRETYKVALDLAKLACSILDEKIQTKDYPERVKSSVKFDKQCNDSFDYRETNTVAHNRGWVQAKNSTPPPRQRQESIHISGNVYSAPYERDSTPSQNPTNIWTNYIHMIQTWLPTRQSKPIRCLNQYTLDSNIGMYDNYITAMVFHSKKFLFPNIQHLQYKTTENFQNIMHLKIVSK